VQLFEGNFYVNKVTQHCGLARVFEVISYKCGDYAAVGMLWHVSDKSNVGSTGLPEYVLKHSTVYKLNRIILGLVNTFVWWRHKYRCRWCVVLLMKQRFVVMHTLRQTEIHALLGSLVTNRSGLRGRAVIILLDNCRPITAHWTSNWPQRYGWGT
jgi:hypothetical protein